MEVEGKDYDPFEPIIKLTLLTRSRTARTSTPPAHTTLAASLPRWPWQIAKSGGSAAPNASTCCKAHTASCVQINDAKDVFESAPDFERDGHQHGPFPGRLLHQSHLLDLNADDLSGDNAKELMCPVPTDVYDPSKREVVVRA